MTSVGESSGDGQLNIEESLLQTSRDSSRIDESSESISTVTDVAARSGIKGSKESHVQGHIYLQELGHIDSTVDSTIVEKAAHEMMKKARSAAPKGEKTIDSFSRDQNVNATVSKIKKKITSKADNQDSALEKLKEQKDNLEKDIKIGKEYQSRFRNITNADSTVLEEKKVEAQEAMEWITPLIEEKNKGLAALNDQIKQREAQIGKLSLKGRAQEIGSKKSASLRTPLPAFLLNAIWSGSASLKIPGLDQAISRSEIKEKDLPFSTLINSKQFALPENNNDIAKACHRYENYSVYPTYPTSPIELTEQHLMLLHALSENDQVKQELLNSSKGSPVYKDLSAEARLLFNQVNLALIKQHMQDIAVLANGLENKPNLSHLGMDYFENEVFDTLARGLSFIDKTLLQGLEIEVPIKQADGTFQLIKYDTNRFNLSGEEKEGHIIDHTKGHPLFFLEPRSSGAPPLVVARGTLLADDGNDGARVSVQADGRKDLSLKWIMENPELEDKIATLHQKHGPLKVCGHSLGGNIAEVLSVRFFSQIDTTVTISAAHVSDEIYDEWKKIPEASRPKVTHILVEGDLIPSGGKKMIGMAVLAEQQDIKGNRDGSSNPVERHLKPFNNNKVRYAAVDKEKEMKKPLRALATGGIVGLGRLLQKKTGFGVFLGTGKRKAALKKLSDAITRQKETALHPIDVNVNLEQLERYSPEQIKTVCSSQDPPLSLSQLLKNVGLETISSSFVLKIFIAAQSDRDERNNIINLVQTKTNRQELNYCLRLYDLQKDPQVIDSK